MKSALALLFALLCAGAAGAQTGLGTVHFQTSCSQNVAGDFDRAVALLHNFEYERARVVFSTVASQDPQCAMAQWGIAMTYVHPLWGDIDLDAGRAAIAAGRKLRATERERMYLDAVGGLFSGDHDSFFIRGSKFADVMAVLHQKYPADDEATVFYGLALAASASRSDTTHMRLKQCDAMLAPLFRRLPDHPGVAHYLIHCSDVPELAPRALEAARRYARIAPDSTHALHMPAHIFVHLGLWDEAIASNLASRQAALDDKASPECRRRDGFLHASQFLQLAYLQAGRQRDARRVIDELMALPPVEGCNHYASNVPAVYAMESGDWKFAAGLDPGAGEGSSLAWQAVGIAAARNGNFDKAKTAEQHLRDGGDSTEIGRLQVAAYLAAANHDEASATQQLRTAAGLYEKAGIGAWQMRPARELLAEFLLDHHHAREAQTEYAAVLERNPHRFNALYGMARAAQQSGDKTAAAKYFRELLATAGSGDRPEVSEARQAVASNPAPGER